MLENSSIFDFCFHFRVLDRYCYGFESKIRSSWGSVFTRCHILGAKPQKHRSRFRKWNQKSKIEEFSVIGNYMKFITVKHRFPKLWPNRWSIRSLFFNISFSDCPQSQANILQRLLEIPRIPDFPDLLRCLDEDIFKATGPIFKISKVFESSRRALSRCAHGFAVDSR